MPFTLRSYRGFPVQCAVKGKSRDDFSTQNDRGANSFTARWRVGAHEENAAPNSPHMPCDGFASDDSHRGSAGSRRRRRSDEGPAHIDAVHRGVGRSRCDLRERRAIVGPLKPGPGPARLQAGPLRATEGGRRRRAVTVEIRRCGLVAGGTRLDHGERCLQGSTSSRATAR